MEILYSHILRGRPLIIVRGGGWKKNIKYKTNNFFFALESIFLLPLTEVLRWRNWHQISNITVWTSDMHPPRSLMVDPSWLVLNCMYLGSCWIFYMFMYYMYPFITLVRQLREKPLWHYIWIKIILGLFNLSSSEGNKIVGRPNPVVSIITQNRPIISSMGIKPC